MVPNFLRLNYQIELAINVLLHLVIDLLFCFTFKTQCCSFLSTWMIHSELDSSLPEVRESESKARSQAEMLKKALDEHDLELRVRASNEAEAAYEKRLSAAQAEIEELRAQFDANERFVFMHTTLITDLLHSQTGSENLFFSFAFSSISVVLYLGVNFLVMRSER